MRRAGIESLALLFAGSLWLAGCGDSKGDPKAEAPPPVTVEHEQDLNVFQVDHPEQFPLATAAAHESASQLTATGTVNPDISRSVPVISIATGRVVEVHARLGDKVKKGQLLLRVQSADMSAAFSDYRKPVADGKLARLQFERAKLLYGTGGREPDGRAARGRRGLSTRGVRGGGLVVPAILPAQKKERKARVPETAILHLRDGIWVYVPAGDKKFRRVEVLDGQMLAGNMQEVISGIKPGVLVVQNALVFQNTVEQ